MSADDAIAKDENDTEKAVLELLLHSPQWPWSVEEVGRELDDLLGAEDALYRLSGAGRVHRHDRFVFPSRAAIRAVDLDLSGK
jgi:hypothetical protein